MNTQFILKICVYAVSRSKTRTFSFCSMYESDSVGNQIKNKAIKISSDNKFIKTVCVSEKFDRNKAGAKRRINDDK